MKYFYRMDQACSNNYYSDRTVRCIGVVEATPERLKEFEEAEASWLWPVHSTEGRSTDFVECQDLNEAYRHLKQTLNHSLYERVNDL